MKAFTDYQKVRGISPQDVVGIRKKNKMERFKQGGAYHKDYAIDPSTGRVRGHGLDDIHVEYPQSTLREKMELK